MMPQIWDLRELLAQEFGSLNAKQVDLHRDETAPPTIYRCVHVMLIINFCLIMNPKKSNYVE